LTRSKEPPGAYEQRHEKESVPGVSATLFWRFGALGAQAEIFKSERLKSPNKARHNQKQSTKKNEVV
jgi:hypothetical protein